MAAADLIGELDFLGVVEPLQQRLLAGAVGVLVELDEDERAQPPLEQLRRQDRDRPCEQAFAPQPAQAPRDRRGRQGDALGELLRGAVRVALCLVEEPAVEIVEHRPHRARFCRRAHKVCGRRGQRPLARFWQSARRNCAQSDRARW